MNDITAGAGPVGTRMTLFGIATMVLGVLAMSAPLLTGVSIAIFVGVLVLAAGIARMTWAFRAGSLGAGVLVFLIGGLTALCGICMVASPLFAAGVLTILLAVYFVADGLSEIAAAFRVRPGSGWGWMLFGGVVSLVLGLMIWRQYPLSGPWAIGILLGIKLFFAGLMMLTLGSAVRSVGREIQA